MVVPKMLVMLVSGALGCGAASVVGAGVWVVVDDAAVSGAGAAASCTAAQAVSDTANASRQDRSLEEIRIGQIPFRKSAVGY